MLNASTSNRAITMTAVHNNPLAVAFALLSALTIALGTVWRHQIVVRHNRQVAEHGSGSTMGAVRRPAWWLSLSLAWVAYGFQAVALAFGSLLVVQPVLVLSLLMTLLLATRVEGRDFEVDETFWAVMLTGSVGVLVIFGRPAPGPRDVAGVKWAVAVGLGVVAMGVFGAVVKHLDSAPRAFVLGAICGALFGYLAVFSKAAVDEFIAGGITGLFSTWPVYALIVTATVGTIVQQYAFGAGHLAHSLPAMKIFEPLLAYALGIGVLGETFRISTPLGYPLMALAVIIMFAATYMLSHKPT